ncbi:uncharacterized protein PG998_012530 [Apiospora kogelbergensis]|uniref:F-box domain-containing protein n=1 Tax=Apiospora kogelbergensis TaxID=1337665 RepID=A0AAW0QN68_9PEZI
MENTANITSLPPEVVLAICEHLSLYECVRLGLTCKYMHYSVEIDRVWQRVRCHRHEQAGKGTVYRADVDDEDRWSFLEELEVVLMDHELCYYCRIFHRRALPKTQSLWRASPGKKGTGTECDAKEVMFPRWGVGDWGVGFRDVHAIMRNHRLGSGFGVPLSEFFISTDWLYADAYTGLHNASRSPFKCFNSYTKLDHEATIINECLLVHRVQRLWVPLHLSGSDVLVRYGLGSIARDFKICSHYNPCTEEMITNFVGPVQSGYCYVLAAAATLGTAQNHLPRQIKRCDDCPTEYEFTYHMHEEDRSVELVLDVWQNFGKCLAPKAAGWLNCWGRSNPRFEAPVMSREHRNIWTSSDIAYVGDETLFPTIAGASAATHTSASKVHEHWMTLKESTLATLSEGRVCPPLVPHMPRRQLEDLKESILKARCQSGPFFPQAFPISFISISDRTVPVAYTHTG